MSRILLIGDSPGEGEWEEICSEHLVTKEVCGCGRLKETFFANTHRGLEKYLNDLGCFVNNTCRAGTSNKHNLDILNHVKPHTYDYIFWFVTNPIFDVDYFHNEPLIANNAADVDRLTDNLFYQSLETANNHAKKFKNGIHLIGSLHPIRADHNLDAYEYLHIACDHFLKLICHEPIPKKFKGCFSHLNDIGDLTIYKFSEEALDYMDDSFKLWHKILQSLSPEFIRYPMTYINRNGHKVLFDYLHQKYNFTQYQDHRF